jgi:secreted trypsin-like serine protease
MQKNLFLNFLFIFILLISIHHSISGEKIYQQICDESEAPLHVYPWMVSIRLNFLNAIKRDCGGVIISDTFILTAASCFRNVTAFVQYFTIKAGIHRIVNVNEPTEQVRFISQLIQHPNYTNNSYLNDLAMIRVSLPFRLDRWNVFPIKLSNLTSVENINLTLIGWGGASPGIVPVPLKQVIVQENVQCTQDKLIDPSTQLCTSGKEFFLLLL